jgi:hypothetical protein
VDIHQHWLREQVEHSNLNIKWIATTDMLADGLTKALLKQRHMDFLHQLYMVDIEQLLKKKS